MNATDIANMLARDAEAVCRKLLPQGKRIGHEWVVGDVAGRVGNSLKVHLDGDKSGVWSDFATGEAGDLLDLWALSNGMSIGEALVECRAHLGIENTNLKQTRQRQYRRPKRPGGARLIRDKQGPVDAYLRGERALTPKTMRDFGIAEADEWINPDPKKRPWKGPWILFPYMRPDGEKNILTNIKWLHVERDPDGKKRTLQEKQAEPCLFGWQALDPKTRVVTITEGECFPGDAEIMTPLGWIRLDEWNGEPVLQVQRNGSAWFVRPSQFVRKWTEEPLLRNEVLGWVSITTPGHKMASIDHKGRWRTHRADKPICRMDKIPRVCNIDGPGIPLSDDAIKLGIAISADASIRKIKNTGYHKGRGDRYVVFGLKKKRKIDRLRGLLNRLGIHSSDNKIASGQQSICFHAPSWVPGRLLPWDWIIFATKNQREMLLKEIIHWDGNHVPNRNQTEYSSKLYQNASWVQTLAHTTGRVSSIIKRQNKYGKWLKVSILHGKSMGSWQTVKASSIPYSGYVYCPTVKSGMILVRQEDKITVSGNCDAMSGHQYGYPSLSVPSGAGSGHKHDWIDTDWELLQRFDIIYLAFDQDEEGEIATQYVGKRLMGLSEIRTITLPGKDMNECLVAGVSKEDIDVCYERSKEIAPELLRPAASFREDTIREFYPQEDDHLGIKTGFRKLDGKFAYRYGEVTLLTGLNFSGKSILMNQMVFQSMDQGERACIASMEMPMGKLLERGIRQITGEIKPSLDLINKTIDWTVGKLWSRDKIGSVNRTEMLEDFSYARRRYDCRIFVIDSLMRCGLPEDDYVGQTKFVDTLLDFARDEDVHVVLVAHSRKPKDEHARVGRFDIKGSGGITDLAFNCLSLWRNVKKEQSLADLEDAFDDDPRVVKLKSKPDAILHIDKQKFGTSWTGKLPLWFEPDSQSYRDTHTGSTPKINTTDTFDMEFQ